MYIHQLFSVFVIVSTIQCLLAFPANSACHSNQDGQVPESVYDVLFSNVKNNEEKRQHWTTGIGPGGKRSFNGLEEDDDTVVSNLNKKKLGYLIWLTILRKNPYNPDLMTRQHWTSGLAPGGRAVIDKKQHWTTGLSPGGKREFYHPYDSDVSRNNEKEKTNSEYMNNFYNQLQTDFEKSDNWNEPVMRGMSNDIEQDWISDGLLGAHGH
uniref:uncharacterized protein LOC120342299 n=1 Tax=Styela clava TaxID=7725 RepID=UPI001939C7F7|nr:uncharacterized protein LOC120342299 [Styela clava]